MFFGKQLSTAQKFALQQQMQNNFMQQQQMAKMMQPVQTPAQQVITQQIRKDPKVREDLYLELRVTNAGAATDVLLFDALGAYTLQNNFTQSPNISIEYTSKSGNGSAAYLYLLNYIATGSVLYFDQVNLQVDNQLQYGRSIGIYDDSLRANNVTLYDTIFPSQGLLSSQFQQDRVEIPYKYKINRSSSFLYTQEANSVLIFRMFCKEMVAVGL